MEALEELSPPLYCITIATSPGVSGAIARRKWALVEGVMIDKKYLSEGPWFVVDVVVRAGSNCTRISRRWLGIDPPQQQQNRGARAT